MSGEADPIFAPGLGLTPVNHAPILGSGKRLLPASVMLNEKKKADEKKAKEKEEKRRKDVSMGRKVSDETIVLMDDLYRGLEDGRRDSSLRSSAMIGVDPSHEVRIVIDSSSSDDSRDESPKKMKMKKIALKQPQHAESGFKERPTQKVLFVS